MVRQFLKSKTLVTCLIRKTNLKKIKDISEKPIEKTNHYKDSRSYYRTFMVSKGMSEQEKIITNVYTYKSNFLIANNYHLLK